MSSSPRQNAFDVVRLLLAFMVVYSHGILLGGFGTEGFARFTKGQTIAGTVGVLGFFGISGFLVTQSAQRLAWREFLLARVLRIYPAFLAVLIGTAFLMAPLIAISTGEPWSARAAVEYVARNSLLRIGQWHVGVIPGSLPYSGSINGSLWSLYPEFLCYLLLMGCVAVRGWRKGRVEPFVIVLGLFALNAAVVVGGARLAPTMLQRIGPPYLLAFSVGGLIALYRTEVLQDAAMPVLWVALVLILLRSGGWNMFAPVLLPLALITCACAAAVRLPADISYGTYLWHFPIFHLLASLGLQRQGALLFVVSGLALTGVVAAASWVFIERPALRFKVSRLGATAAAYRWLGTTPESTSAM
jgi:peptidoglycan/LPS O-acetylase OafA/YrhL